MNRHVDDAGRALLAIRVASASDTPHTEVLAWIDTAFDGYLASPVGLIKELELESPAQAEGSCRRIARNAGNLLLFR